MDVKRMEVKHLTHQKRDAIDKDINNFQHP